MAHQHFFFCFLLRSSWLLALSSPAAFGQQVATMPLLAADAKPALFAPGVATTPYTEWSTSFSPDGNTVYFSQGAVYWTIVSAHRRGSGWAPPEVVSFSGEWNDTDPFVSPDGKRLFFISNRPLPDSAQDKPQKTYHIWYVE
ncbi:MAG: TolB family protein [Janthinobacterium lividum]